MYQQTIIVGNVGKDPQTRSMPNGNAVANFSVATSEKWKDKQSGENKEHTEWHQVAVFGRQAENVAEYVRKGSKVMVVGRLRTEKWQDKEGNDRYTTKLIADRVQFLSFQNDEDSGRQEEPRPSRGAARQAAAAEEGFDDDIPF